MSKQEAELTLRFKGILYGLRIDSRIDPERVHEDYKKIVLAAWVYGMEAARAIEKKSEMRTAEELMEQITKALKKKGRKPYFGIWHLEEVLETLRDIGVIAIEEK